MRPGLLVIAAAWGCSASDPERRRDGRGAEGIQDMDDSAIVHQCPDAFDRAALPTRDAVEAELASLVELGPQMAGSEANEQWIMALEGRLAALPGVTVERLRVPVPETTVMSGRMVGTWDGVSTDIPLQAVLPVSGNVDAPSRYVEPGAEPPDDIRGKVALIELRFDGMAVDGLRSVLLFESDPRGTLHGQAEYAAGAWLERPWLLTRTQQQIDSVVDAGAVGVVLLGELSADLAGDLHLQLDAPSVPVVLVSDALARRLRDAARVGTGFQAALEVDASQSGGTAGALRVRLGGATPEAVVLHAASDPLNVVEGSGAVALAGIVEALSSLDPGCRPRDLIIDISPGHRSGFAGVGRLGAALNGSDVAWVGVMAQAGAIEHLPDGAVGRGLVRTGLVEPRLLSVKGGSGLAERVIEQSELDGLDRAWVLDRPEGFGAAVGLIEQGVPVVERHSGPWTLPFARRGLAAVDATDLRSDAAWMGGLFLSTGVDSRAELAGE